MCSLTAISSSVLDMECPGKDCGEDRNADAPWHVTEMILIALHWETIERRLASWALPKVDWSCCWVLCPGRARNASWDRVSGSLIVHLVYQEMLGVPGCLSFLSNIQLNRILISCYIYSDCMLRGDTRNAAGPCETEPSVPLQCGR